MNIYLLLKNIPLKKKRKTLESGMACSQWKTSERKNVMPFSMLLNIVGSSNAQSKDVLLEIY